MRILELVRGFIYGQCSRNLWISRLHKNLNSKGSRTLAVYKPPYQFQYTHLKKYVWKNAEYETKSQTPKQFKFLKNHILWLIWSGRNATIKKLSLIMLKYLLKVYKVESSCTKAPVPRFILKFRGEWNTHNYFWLKFFYLVEIEQYLKHFRGDIIRSTNKRKCFLSPL